jgi:hypothetical protein
MNSLKGEAGEAKEMSAERVTSLPERCRPARLPVACQWLLHPTPSGVAEPRLELRLCQGPDQCRAPAAHSTLIDKDICECLTLHLARRMNGFAVIEILDEVMLCKDLPVHIRPNNGPER